MLRENSFSTAGFPFYCCSAGTSNSISHLLNYDSVPNFSFSPRAHCFIRAIYSYMGIVGGRAALKKVLDMKSSGHHVPDASSSSWLVMLLLRISQDILLSSLKPNSSFCGCRSPLMVGLTSVCLSFKSACLLWDVMKHICRQGRSRECLKIDKKRSDPELIREVLTMKKSWR